MRIFLRLKHSSGRILLLLVVGGEGGGVRAFGLRLRIKRAQNA